MSDEELIARLLDFDRVTVGDARDAAARIEALLADVEKAKKGLRKILRTAKLHPAGDIAISTLLKLTSKRRD